MKIDGSCHCGDIRYKAEVNPDNVIICHCTDCQTLSGGAFRTAVPAVEGTFVLLSGAPKRYVKTGESGNKREQAFCGNCGTHLYSAPPRLASRVVALRVGSIRQRDQLVPKDQYWCRSSQKWLQGLSSIKRTEKQPVFDPKGGFGSSTID
ncbi:GFA family protein [Bradyrhizobium yuanmingense]|uniref:GFA family protein n=1 Tax=Bradyrhizobium yuanmingense TaxID=108015 RepID=UPI0006887376|nr:GFA family protein [Bradyrhizobium yuanmingense]